MKESTAHSSSILSQEVNKWPYHKRSLVWIGLAILVLMMSRFLPVSFFERWYYNGLFIWLRVGYDTLFGWFPIPMIYILVLFVLVRAIRWSFDWKKGFLYQTIRALGGISGLVFFFYTLWGFNYKQIALQDRLGFNLEKVTVEEMEAEFMRATAVLKKEAEELPEQYTSDISIATLDVKDHDLREDVERALFQLKVPHKGRVRVRHLWPNGLLLRWSTAGIYISHVFEGHIDGGLLSVQKPFTIAHEMTHGYGITDEGACNFVAWLACSQSKDKWIRFGGAFTYWRYAAAEMPGTKVEEVMHTFDPVVMRSLMLVRENDRRYPDLLPKVRDAIYSSYLERHGVKGGLQSYNYVVMMVSQYLKPTSELNSVK